MAAHHTMLPSLFLVVVAGALVGYTEGQITTNQSPPNCVCPTMNSSSFGSPQMQSNSGSNQMQWGGQGGQGGQGGRGGRGKHMKTICGSDGQNYTDKCAFVNAQYSNQNLGKRPCKTMQMMNTNMNGMKNNNNLNGMNTNVNTNSNDMMSNSMMNGNMDMMGHGSGSHEQRQKTMCLTNGQNVTGTMWTINQQLQTSPGLGIRCDRSCPCPPLACPTMDRNKHQRNW